MKIVVDELPKSPKECAFSKRHDEVGYICTLRPYIKQIGSKTICVCKSVDVGVHCDQLITFERMMEENHVKQYN